MDLSQLEELHQVTRDANLSRSTVTYNALLTALYRHKAYAAMDAVFHDMTREHDKRRNEPDAITITLMMRAATALGNTVRRDQLFQLAKLTRQTDAGVLGAMLDAASQAPVRHKDGTTLKLITELSERLYNHLADNSVGDNRRTEASLHAILYAQFRHLPSNEDRLRIVQRLRALTAESDELQATLLSTVVDTCHQLRFRKWRAFLTDAVPLWSEASSDAGIVARVQAALEVATRIFPSLCHLIDHAVIVGRVRPSFAAAQVEFGKVKCLEHCLRSSLVADSRPSPSPSSGGKLCNAHYTTTHSPTTALTCNP